eukprot:3797451-Amphidinium_carterae.1
MLFNVGSLVRAVDDHLCGANTLCPRGVLRVHLVDVALPLASGRISDDCLYLELQGHSVLHYWSGGCSPFRFSTAETLDRSLSMPRAVLAQIFKNITD